LRAEVAEVAGEQEYNMKGIEAFYKDLAEGTAARAAAG